jgi:hypothetical protein
MVAPGLASRPVQTIELTSKRWKLLQLGGGLLLIFSLFLCFRGMSNNEPEGLIVPGLGGLLGLALLASGRIGAWWHNR